MDNLQTLRQLYLQCRFDGTPVDANIAALAIRAVGDYAGIRSQYVNDIQGAMVSYMLGDTGMAVAKGQFKRAMATAFVDGFETGYLTGAGGDVYEPESEDTQWLADRTNQELSYIDGLFQTMKDLLKGATAEEPVTQQDKLDFAQSHAIGYGNTLDGVYAQGKLRSRKNIMLWFSGEDGLESCPECQQWKGKKHTAKFWISRDLIPGIPGTMSFSCHGYQCQHFLEDSSGNRWTGSE